MLTIWIKKINTQETDNEIILEILKIIVVGNKQVGLKTYDKKVFSEVFNQSTLESMGVDFSLKFSENHKSIGYQLSKGLQNVLYYFNMLVENKD